MYNPIERAFFQTLMVVIFWWPILILYRYVWPRKRVSAWAALGPLMFLLGGLIGVLLLWCVVSKIEKRFFKGPISVEDASLNPTVQAPTQIPTQKHPKIKAFTQTLPLNIKNLEARPTSENALNECGNNDNLGGLIIAVMIVFGILMITINIITGGQQETAQDGANQGIAQDYQKTIEWHQKAAYQGDAEAQAALGGLYYFGQGVAQDYQKAFEWHQKAAYQGLAAAQFNLGYMYYNGQGVEQDYQKAFEWYQKAAYQGLAAAQHNLSLMYQYGQGVAQDYQNALEWRYKASDQRDTSVQAEVYAQKPVGRLDGSYQSVDTEGKICATVVVESEPGIMTCTVNNICNFSVSLRSQGHRTVWVFDSKALTSIDSGGIYGTGCDFLDTVNLGDEAVETTPLGGPDDEGRVTIFQIKALHPALASKECFGQYYKLADY